MKTETREQFELNPGHYCGERDRSFEVVAVAVYESRTRHAVMKVNAPSAAKAKQIAQREGWIVQSVRKLNY